MCSQSFDIQIKGLHKLNLIMPIYLFRVRNISMKKSLAAHDYKLSGDQAHARAQYNYGIMLDEGDGISMNKSLTRPDLSWSVDQGLISAQLRFGISLGEGPMIKRNTILSAHYFKLAADQGSTEAQIEAVEWLLGGDGVPGTLSLIRPAGTFKLQFLFSRVVWINHRSLILFQPICCHAIPDWR
jgi:hypothetical protein